MAASSETPIAADRFAEYVEELQAFSRNLRVPFGKPENIASLLAAFKKSPDFAEDFGSMLRSIVLREHFRASDAELLTLVAAAWGGPNAEAADEQLPAQMEELRIVLKHSLKPPAPKPPASETELQDEAPEATPDVDDTLRELEQSSPDVQMYKQFLKIQDEKDPPFVPPDAEKEEKKTAPQRGNFPFHKAAERASIEAEAEARTRPSRPVLSYGTEGRTKGAARKQEGSAKPRRAPSIAEFLALALTGLVVALLLDVETLPIYETRVSVYLASASDTSTSAPLLDGTIADKVAEHLLAEPHPNPLLKQDALSRGERDLQLGGRETILYADLVADTAHRVKVTHLQPQNLYAITCDSWSAQFATTFCDQVIAALSETPANATPATAPDGTTPPATATVRTVDAATGPGLQIYPHWYTQGFIGFSIGCILSLLLVFVKQSPPEPVAEDGMTTI